MLYFDFPRKWFSLTGMPGASLKKKSVSGGPAGCLKKVRLQTFFFHFCKKKKFFQKWTNFPTTPPPPPPPQKKIGKKKMRPPDRPQLRPPGGQETDFFLWTAWQLYIQFNIEKDLLAEFRLGLAEGSGRLQVFRFGAIDP